MSWQLASFLILGTVLLAGFAWYERSRPPSQVVALVAALAALAVAGRIAFAALPNVKPTTDIVIFAGYALGGAPGFAVGALAALVSNFWFGQGPWTPWQMVAWGLCGVLGAALALGVRNAGRFTLAATCGFAGILFGALLNFSLMATYGGDLSWQRFSLLEVRAIPFEAAHVGANVALALVAGPAMVRMLTRFRERFAWRRGTGTKAPAPGFSRALRGGGLAALLLLLALAAGTLAPARAEASSVSRAADWLESTQNPDGGFGASVGDDSGAETTCWVMLGLAAAGRNPLDVTQGGHTPVDFLRNELGSVHSPGDLARTILALESAGADPRDFGGRNLVSDLLASRRDDGSYHGWPNSTAFAVIALRASGVDGVDKTLEWLREAQNADGGWGDTGGSPSNADATGAVLQALSSDSTASHRGVKYLERAQHKGGGYPLGGNGEINTQSTAWAVQGLLAAGRDPGSFRRGGASALDYLANNQRPDGSYRYSKPSATVPAEVAGKTPVFVTGEVLVAAAGKYFPVAAPPRKPQPQSKPAQPSGTPSEVAPLAELPEATESLPTTPSAPVAPAGGSGSGSSGSAGSVPLTPFPKGAGGGKSGVPPAGAVIPGEAPESTSPPLSEASGEQAAETTQHSSSTAGSIVLGLLAGCVLFGLGLAARKGWMHWRYGL